VEKSFALQAAVLKTCFAGTLDFVRLYEKLKSLLTGGEALTERVFAKGLLRDFYDTDVYSLTYEARIR
jgi:hypothetical protein